MNIGTRNRPLGTPTLRPMKKIIMQRILLNDRSSGSVATSLEAIQVRFAAQDERTFRHGGRGQKVSIEVVGGDEFVFLARGDHCSLTRLIADVNLAVSVHRRSESIASDTCMPVLIAGLQVEAGGAAAVIKQVELCADHER